MSVANANAFALLDDEGTIDAGELAAKLPVRQNDVLKKELGDSKQGACLVKLPSLSVMNRSRSAFGILWNLEKASNS
jgi:hypothetical protein